MINFNKTHRSSYEIKINNKKDLLSLMNYLENVETNEPIKILYNEKVYTLLVNLTETSNNIKFDNSKKEITMDLDMEDVEDWIDGLELSIVEKEFNPAELFEFKLKGKTINTYMTITLDEI